MASLTLPFLQRSRQWQHLKVSPSQSVNFNEHPDLKQWKLISQSAQNVQRSLHMCVVEGKEMKGSYSLLTINQLSKTILQSCSASLIWPLEYCPSADENWSNMTSPVLICRYSDVGKLMQQQSQVVVPSYHCSNLTYLTYGNFFKGSLCSSCFLCFTQWVYWSSHNMLLNHWSGKLEDELMIFVHTTTSCISKSPVLLFCIQRNISQILLPL